MMSFFRSSQDDYFAELCKKRFKWQTGNPFIAEAERNLLHCLAIKPGSRVLEVGTGTGSNLHNLRELSASFLFVGTDINEDETHFARDNFPDDYFFVGDATNIALSDGAFDVVFCRDLLHHIELVHRKAVLEEMARLTRPGGQVVVIEPNGRNLIIKGFGRLVKSERGLLQSFPDSIERLLRNAAGLKLVGPVPQYAEPNNLFRLLLHYHLGLPWLAKVGFVRTLLRAFNQFAGRIVPPERWAYMIFTGMKK